MNRITFFTLVTIGIRLHPFAAVFGGLALWAVAQFYTDKHYAAPPEPTATELHQKAIKLSRWAAYASLQAGHTEYLARKAEKQERHQHEERIAEL